MLQKINEIKSSSNSNSLESEIWKDILGYEGHYQISNLGRVKSVKSNGLIRKPHQNKDGYLYVSLTKECKNRTLKVHRLVAQHFLQKVDGKNHIDHIDGNKINNKVHNLRWCTHSENIHYAWGLGIYKNIGEGHALSILKVQDVIRIKELLSNGYTAKEINELFPQVKINAIFDIKQGRTWGHLQ